ncbi:MAG TPA: S8 family serine peptidase [Oscillatoriaceae cyanobacterium]
MKRVALALLPALLAACQANPLLMPPASPASVPHQLLVRFQSGVTDAQRAEARALVGAREPIGVLPDAERWTLPAGTSVDGAIARVQADADVKFAQANRIHHLEDVSTAAFTPPGFALPARTVEAVSPDDPDYHLQWDLPDDHFDAVWGSDTGKGVTVAVIDSGVDPDHPDLKANLLPLVDEIAAMGKHDLTSDGSDYDGKDGHGHGTHVCGIVGAVADNGVGISGGAPGVKILPVKVADFSGDADDATITKGIEDAVDKGAQVINLSIGGPQPSNLLLDALNYAFNHNVTVVIAAGNSGQDGEADGVNYEAVNYPAAYKGVIAVGATTPSNHVAAYSSHSAQMVVVAPGGDTTGPGIFSTTPTYPCEITEDEGKQPKYDYLAGTSMAAPQVTAAVALLLNQTPGLSPAQVRTRIAASATPLGSQGYTETYGYGALNVQKLLSDTSDDGR